MPKNAYLLAALVPLVAMLAMPYVASAAINSNVWSIKILQGPLISCTGAGAPGGTDSKNCTSICDLVTTAGNVVYFGIGVVIWILTPIMFLWGGISLILSRGNPEGMSAAKNRITRIVIGLLIVLCAYLIVSTFVSVLGATQWIGGFGTASCSL